MKKIFVVFVGFLITMLMCLPIATARFGGMTIHSEGSTSHISGWSSSTSHVAGEGTSHSNVYGGSTTHVYGQGTTHTNIYGGRASHTTGGGWSKTGAYGGTAYGDVHYGGAYHPPPQHPASVTVYHPPTTVNVYGAGCYNCGGWSTASAAAAGTAVGAVAGSAAASAKTGGASGATPAQTNYVMGAIYPTVPAGSITIDKGGTTYYLSGNTWFKPAYGANGVYYRVVPTP